MPQPQKQPAKPAPGPHKPTAEHRKLVETYAAYGIPQEDIAKAVGISPETLRRHYRDELDSGSTKATARVAGNLYRMATGTGREAVTAAIFWMKTRAGWREVNRLEAQVDARVEHSGQVDTKLVHDFRADPQMVAAVAKVLLEAGVGIEDQSGEDKP